MATILLVEDDERISEPLLRVLATEGFDVIHACNPPDLIFLIGGFFKLFLGKKFVFDHHDINPELFEAKFGRRNFLYRVVTALERWTFAVADISIATNNSYRAIAIERGGMRPDRVFVVRSGPNLGRLKIVSPDPSLKKGRTYCVGYVGVLGAQEGLKYLLEAAKYIVHVLGRDDVGYLAPGMAADFIGYRLDTLDLAGGAPHDPLASLIFCQPAKVDLSVINGQVRIQDQHLLAINVPKLVQQHNIIARALVRDELR